MSASEYDHRFVVKTPKSVYPPREDTLFLARCIPEPQNGLKTALEIGSGSGFLSMTLAAKGWKVTSIDVNPLAVAATKSNTQENGYPDIHCMEGSFDEIECLQEGMFDLIIWNLPYLTIPTSGPHLEPIEEASMLDLGTNGWSSELRSYLESHQNMLSRTGCVLLLYRTYPDSPSKPEDWIKSGWTSRKMSQKTMGDEMLSVYSHWRPWGGLKPIQIDTIKSTMDYDFMDREGVQRVIANTQIKGRGRRGKDWISDPDGLAATWCITGQNDFNSGMFQIVLGAMISRSLGFELKWPNDIIDANLKKCGGIMFSMEGEKTLKIGVGINKTPQPIHGIQTTGWEVVNGGMGKRHVFNMVDACVATLFESHPLFDIVSIENYLQFAWCSLSKVISRGIILHYRGDLATVSGLTSQGEIIVAQRGSVTEVCDLDEIEWGSINLG